MKAAREQAGLTQMDAALELGVTKGALSAWENGKNFPQLQVFIELCKLYRASADSLLLAPAGAAPTRVHEPHEPYLGALDQQLIERVSRLTAKQQKGLLDLLASG